MSTTQDQSAQLIELRPQGPLSSEPPFNILTKTESLQIVRLVLPKGKEIPTHHAQGEITVHCLEGEIAFTVGDTTYDLKPGNLLFVAAARPHSLVAREDAIALVTKSLK